MKQMWGRHIGLAGAGLIAMMLTSPSLAAIKPSVEVEARLGYDMNPFLQGGDDLASGYGAVSVRPKLTAATGRGQTVLSGHYDRTEYLRRYGHTDEYGGALEVQQRVSPKLSLFGALRYDHSVVGADDNVVSGAPIDDTDINLLGTRSQVNTYAASGGFTYAVTSKDVVSADGGYTDTRYENRVGNNNSNLGGRLAYNHAISSATKIGVSGSIYRIDYDTPGLSTLVMQPNVTFSTEISARLHFDASIGVSFTNVDLPVGPNDRSTGIAGDANLCYTGERSKFCFFASRTVSGSGFGGTSRRSQAGVNFDQRLTERMTFTAGGSYARSSSLNSTLPLREYVSGRLGLRNRFTNRLTVGIEGQYRDVFGAGYPVKSDFGAEINATLALPGAK